MDIAGKLVKIASVYRFVKKLGVGIQPLLTLLCHGPEMDKLYVFLPDLMTRIAIFASGSGSNAENIARYFSNSATVQIGLILTNNAEAGVIARAGNLGIPSTVFNRDDLNKNGRIEQLLEDEKIDFIVLAGFLWLVPASLIKKYEGRIVNVHPALLPAFGGKGFYGERVHKAVIEAGELISGITIHHVNEHFDEGAIIFQAACHVSKADNAETLAGKIHELEYRYFPVVIDKMLKARAGS